MGNTLIQGLLVAFFSLSLTTAAEASDPDQPHPHQGILQTITSPPKPLTLTDAELERLANAERIQRQTEDKGGGSGIAVQYIWAVPETIWKTILSYAKYPSRVKNVVSCDVYKRDGNDLYVDMRTSIIGFKSGIFTRNTVRKDQGYMSWSLDYSRKSDVDDLVGYWRVELIQEEPAVSKLEYYTEMKIKGVPGFLVRYMTKDALAEGTAWVKRYSEQSQ